MSLRFLKAKPKLTLSKDNKVRSTSKKVDFETSDGYQVKPHNKELQEKTLECLSIPSSPIPDTMYNNEKIKTKDKEIDISTVSCADSTHNVNMSPTKDARSEDYITKQVIDSDQILIKEKNATTKTESDVPPTCNSHELKTLNKTSSINKFRFLKAKPKLGLNILSKIRTKQQQEEDVDRNVELENKMKIKDTSHKNEDLDINDGKGKNNHNEIKAETIDDSISADKISSMLKSIPSDEKFTDVENFKDKPVDILISNKTETGLAHASNTLDYLSSKSDQKQTPQVNLHSLSSKSEQKQNSRVNKQLKITSAKKPSLTELEKVSPSKTKSLSSYIKQLEHQKLLSSQQNIVEKMPTPALATTKPLNNKTIKRKKNAISCFENDGKDVVVPPLKPNEQCGLTSSTSNVQTVKGIHQIDNKERSYNKRKEIYESSMGVAEANSLQSKVKQLSNLIHNNMELLKKSETTTFEHNHNADRNAICDNIVLTEENIKLMPIVIEDSDLNSNACKKSCDDENNCAPEDHIYAKPFTNKNICPLSRKIFEPTTSENEYTCEPRDFVDVNAFTSTKNEQSDALAIDGSCSENNTLSGLSLVASIIKEENDPSSYESCYPMDQARLSEQDYSLNYCKEEVIYNENVVEIVDPTWHQKYYVDHEETIYKYQENSFLMSPRSRKRKNVTFNLEEDDIIKLNEKPNKIIKVENENKMVHEKSILPVDLDDTRESLKKETKDKDYKLDEDTLSSGSEIDLDEREFVIRGIKSNGGKRKISNSVYSKRHSETMKKINTQMSWKENLTVNDLIFYNPETNPMSNPPDLTVVKKNEVVTDMSEKVSHENENSEDEEDVDNPEPVPQLKISADGKLIIDPKSLIIEETGLKRNKERIKQSEALIESKYTFKKFDNLYSKRKMKRQSYDWGPEDTIMFYRAVNTIGTDFSMMATLFENRSRADIKRKFKLEERKNPSLLSRALVNFNSFDIDELKCELDADRKRVEKIKQEEKERKKNLEDIKKLKRIAKANAKRNGRTSVCGTLTQDCSVSSLPEYKLPHHQIFKIINSQRKPGSNISKVSTVCS